MNKNLAFRKIDDKIPLFYVHNKLVCDSICVATTIEKSRFYCAAELAQIIVMQNTSICPFNIFWAI